EKRVFLVILFTSFSGSLVSRIPGAVQIDDRQKKTCASAQAGVIHVLNPKLTSPINTSGITTLAT
ncbi:hypothetical protein, partial [Escherichia coli]|uniref:hypothetical protein n=1 Tax=Escherichia coli TaxID=562 RepID=UPI001BC8A239